MGGRTVVLFLPELKFRDKSSVCFLKSCEKKKTTIGILVFQLKSMNERTTCLDLKLNQTCNVACLAITILPKLASSSYMTDSE